ncbi:hypothetical protein, partial [Streptomyces sp. NPDC001076]
MQVLFGVSMSTARRGAAERALITGWTTAPGSSGPYPQPACGMVARRATGVLVERDGHRDTVYGGEVV